ncbi:excinuclease ABC subunit UvrA [Streptomyces sp. JV185]|uniref:excinuclease ABC subunit UvrA n=1 Tax=Streptomyces sp. JV185 TaxID=858638 RepID=UPI002E798413|nr:excinuclease ABC subunit UvrA [Streptomyces sp. JV185]MEE1767067.1 excinuclease ABC subunit UvrA [Streptomyces sp. JV185]
MAQHFMRIAGAREHNLKGISVSVPREKITVVTGVSGSGKSSLVFGTIAAESQRQLAETFSSFVRNRLPRQERPQADLLDHLAPAVVIDQRPVGGGARSTVGTMTDIYTAIRLLFSRIGTPSAGESTAYSFNDPRGMCPECSGLGRVRGLDLDAFLDRSKSLNQGAIRFKPFEVGSVWWQTYAESGLFDPDLPVGDFGPQDRDTLLYGKGFRVPRRNKSTGERGYNAYEGLVVRFNRLYLDREAPAHSRAAVRRVVTEGPCPECGGSRLNEAARASRIDGRSIADFAALDAVDLLAELKQIDDPVGGPVAAAAAGSLERLVDIGLGYLSLDRATASLSGGEAQRLKTVRQLGSSLSGLTYIFDEPTTGLHPRDVHRLTDLLRQLRDKGNTVLVVEHDRDVMAAADHAIDLGPGAGARGGEVVYEGPAAGLATSDTVTGRWLRRGVPVREEVRKPARWFTVEGAALHNLRDVTVAVPLGVLTAVTGVAGSGKSSLIAEFVRRYGNGAEDAESVMVVDQSAPHASSRSTVISYLGLLDTVRRLFARATGADAGLFSFNSRGACPDCRGLGVIRTDLGYLDPVTTRCAACAGRRFSPEALRHTVGGLSIADVLDLTADQAAEHFAAEPALRTPLLALAEVGLGYVTLGQALTALSGGERQRLKLAGRLDGSGGMYVFDEPTTGLHMADVETLTGLLDRLVGAGNTVLVVEHNLDVVKRADWVLDLGPDGGRDGGRVVFEGTPAQLAAADTATAEYLRRDLAA